LALGIPCGNDGCKQQTSLDSHNAFLNLDPNRLPLEAPGELESRKKDAAEPKAKGEDIAAAFVSLPSFSNEPRTVVELTLPPDRGGVKNDFRQLEIVSYLGRQSREDR
jgi:hypothetical protein